MSQIEKFLITVSLVLASVIQIGTELKRFLERLLDFGGNEVWTWTWKGWKQFFQLITFEQAYQEKSVHENKYDKILEYKKMFNIIVRWDFLLFCTEILQCLSVPNWPLQPLKLLLDITLLRIHENDVQMRLKTVAKKVPQLLQSNSKLRTVKKEGKEFGIERKENF